MINRSRYVIWDGEFLFAPLPKRSKNSRRVIIKIVDALHDKHVVNLHNPSAKKSHNASGGHNQLEVWHDKSLGGELNGPTVWVCG